MLRRILNRLSDIIHHRPLAAPSSRETELLNELRADFRDLPVIDSSDALPSEAEWWDYMNRLRELVLDDDPREFSRWDVVKATMFVSDAPYLRTELNYLRQRPDWNTRWRIAIEESSVGHPKPYRFHPQSSGNLIHHAYHLAQFEEKTCSLVQERDLIFEFGGGYGSMCRLFFNLGFQGRYIIFDLPPFSLLQRYFLKSLGLSVLPVTELRRSETGIACVTDLQELTSLLEIQTQARNKTFLATWSISESPENLRNSILEFVTEFNSFLISYQDRFGEVNNLDFFDRWKQARDNVAWHQWQIKHIPGNSYLVGTTPMARTHF